MKRKNIIIITGASSGMGAEFARQMDPFFTGIDEFWLIARSKDKLQMLSETLRHRTRLIAEDMTFADSRRKSGEGSDPDPWEFCYLMLDCASAKFEDCTFVEGLMVDQDVTFTDCTFTMGSQKYEGDSKEYNTDHYGLWIYNNGDIVVDGCSFVGMTYGAIKSTWNHYGSGADLTIVVKDTSFSAATTSAKAPLNLDGAVSVELSNVTATGFATGNVAEYVECDLEEVVV